MRTGKCASRTRYTYRKASFLKLIKYFLNDVEVPKLEFLHKRGGKYGEFVDTETDKYDGYNFSYALVRFLCEKKEKSMSIK